MRNVMHNWMIRAGSRLPELTAATCLILGLIAAGWVITGNARNASHSGKPAQVKPIEISAKASSSAMQLAGEVSAR